MLSESNKRFILSLFTLLYHISFIAVFIYALYESINDMCQNPYFVTVVFGIGNIWFLIHDLYGIFTIHPKDYRNYNMDLFATDEAQIRQSCDSVFNYITFGLMFIMFGLSCYSYHTITNCDKITSIIIMVEISAYILMTLLEVKLLESLYNKKKMVVNEENHLLV